MKTALIVLNGHPPKALPNVEQFDLICAVDGAYNHLQKFDIIPDLITGDFDSLDTVPDSIEIVNTPNQDFTDFEKALQVLFEREIINVSIYGGSGNESDHFLGNVSVALAWKNKLNIRFYDEFGSYFFIQNNFETSDVMDKTVSLIPFPLAKGITTKGLQFPLNGEDLIFGGRIGTRNKAISQEISIDFKEGNLLIYISNQA